MGPNPLESLVRIGGYGNEDVGRFRQASATGF